MASFLNKIKIHNAQQTRNMFDLSHIHLTTQGFYTLKPVYSKECIPGEKINVNYSAFTRLLPLEQPMMAHVNIVTRAFFVPYRVVWPMFTSFITGTSYTNQGYSSFPKQVPSIRHHHLRDMFSERSLSTPVSESQKYDFHTIAQSGVSPYRKFTAYGRRVYDLLLSLGYSINLSDTSPSLGSTDFRFSALPLLSYARCFFDWLRNTNYDNDIEIEKFFHKEVDSLELSATEVLSIVEHCLTPQYRTDLFTSAYDYPTGPNSNANNVSFDMGKLTSGDNVQKVERSANFQGEPLIVPSAGTFTQNALYVLHALTDYYQRFRAAGTRVLDRYFAEFGVRLSEERLQRSSYLGGAEKEISVMDVMDTSSTGLGDYAGKGIGDISGSFDYECQEYGHIILLTYIEPRTSVVQGFNRNNIHLNRFDFFQGDMDAIGYQAIAKGELMCDYKGDDPSIDLVENNYTPLGVFGYTGRYAEYKVAHDKLTGDFRCPSVNGTYDTWHLFRMLYNGNDVTAVKSDFPYDEELVHSLQYTTPSKPSVYNRVFGYNYDLDAFFVRWAFNAKSSLPAKPLYEQYEYASHGQSEVINLGGTNVTNN